MSSSPPSPLTDTDASAAAAADALLAAASPPVVSWREIRRFATPALALWLVSPLLSLIDTAAVGLSATPGQGALQLAALGPATTFCDGAAYLFAFLNIATTNLYAAATARVQAADADVSTEVDISSYARKSARADREALVRCAALVALRCGGLTLALLALFAPALLRLYVGGASVRLLAQATLYVRLRMLALPAVCELLTCFPPRFSFTPPPPTFLFLFFLPYFSFTYGFGWFALGAVLTVHFPNVAPDSAPDSAPDFAHLSHLPFCPHYPQCAHT